MSDERPLVDEVLDHVLYAPVGIAVGIYRSLSKALGDRKEFVDHSREIASELARTVGSSVISFANDAFDKITESGKDLSNRVLDNVRHGDAAAPSLDASQEQTPSFPIANYDDLPTAELIAQLSSLSVIDRMVIREHEVATRNRRTVLGRLDQLDHDENFDDHH